MKNKDLLHFILGFLTLAFILVLSNCALDDNCYVGSNGYICKGSFENENIETCVKKCYIENPDVWPLFESCAKYFCGAKKTWL